MINEDTCYMFKRFIAPTDSIKIPNKEDTCYMFKRFIAPTDSIKILDKLHCAQI